jgi:ribonuclease HI
MSQNANKESSRVTLITDGACLGNPGPGGWAAILRNGTTEKMISGGEAETTNNRMEMTAVIQGLSALKRRCQVLVITDSKYVMDAFEKKWIEGWLKRSWKTSSGDPVKNQDLWEILIEGVESHDVSWQWVRGHTGHVDNERVDSEAQAMARKASARKR